MRSLTKAMFRTWPFTFSELSSIETSPPAQRRAGDASITLRRYGLRFQHDPNTYSGRFIHYRRIFEERLLATIEEQLQPGITFIDVGANIGIHSVVATRLVGPRGRVIAFETSSEMRARLQGNIEINSLKNVVVRPHALGREYGQATLPCFYEHNGSQSTGDEQPSEVIEIRTLDDQLRSADLTSGCVIKIDAEGAEMEVLNGGRNFIHQARPRAMFIECIDRQLQRFNSSREAVFEFLHQAGYEVFTLRQGVWVRTEEAVDGDLMGLPEKGESCRP